MKYLKTLFLLALIISAHELDAQIVSRIALPVALQTDTLCQPPIKKLELSTLQLTKKTKANHCKNQQVGICKNITINTKSDGSWTELPNGKRLWRIAIESEGAEAMEVFFSQYTLPAGAELYCYNADMHDWIGPFTETNNKRCGKLQLGMVDGSLIIVELSVPKNQKFELEIGNVSHIFQRPTLEGSEFCHIDINCDEGSAWQKEKYAVCLYFYTDDDGGRYTCTGSLVNNTRQDGTPYFLTAGHCINSVPEAESIIVYFDLEHTKCNYENDNYNYITISGSDLLATAPPPSDTVDFSLIKLSETPQGYHKPVYAGWETNNRASLTAASIHHPYGDVKKIAINSKGALETIQDDIFTDYKPGSQWLVGEWEQGSTQNGSSGAPLFNANHMIVGTLSGGLASCHNTWGYDFFSKFKYAWNHIPDEAAYTADGKQIQPNLHKILDPESIIDPNNVSKSFLSSYSPFIDFDSFINRDILDDHFIVFPNPTAGLIQIYNDNIAIEEVDVTIYDMYGNVVKIQYNAPTRQSFYIDDLPSGSYLVHVDGLKPEFRKLILAKP